MSLPAKKWVWNVTACVGGLVVTGLVFDTAGAVSMAVLAGCGTTLLLLLVSLLQEPGPDGNS